jgi:hypothetical protein
MHARRAALVVATCLAACDVSVTVGYNDALVPGASCTDDAPLRACSTETCVVTELTAAQMGKETLAVDAEHIYFITETDVISSMPKGGGQVVELATVAPSLERLTVDEENVYWTEFDGRILRVPKTGGPTESVTEIFGHPTAIASHVGDLYLVMTDSGEVAKVTKSSGATTTLAGQGAPIDLGLDSEHVYWINQGQPGEANGELVRAPLGDLTSAEVILSSLDEPLVLGVTEDAILWATYDKVFRLSRDGGDPQLFEAPIGEPKGVTELGGTLYVAGETGVYRIRVGDGDALALDGRGMTGLALACDGLYAVGWFEPILLRYGP